MRTRTSLARIFGGMLAVSLLPIIANGPASATAGTVTRQGSQLYLGGAPYRFTGLNAYELATYWGVNAGCGPMVSDADLDGFFAGLRPDSMVRFWAFQGLATNATTKARDWRGIDRVVNAATRHGQRLIVTMVDQWASGCDDGHYKDVPWYQGGYMQAFNDNGKGIAPASYWTYMHELVARYASSPAIGMWELVNEPEAKPSSAVGCDDEATARMALRSFFDTVGGELHRIDPTHLISSGAMGSGQCGLQGADYQYVHQSQGIDVASYHDYGSDNSPIPGDQWNGLQVRIDQMSAIAKPLLIGESGMLAQDGSASCMSFASRRDKLQAKMAAQFAAGIDGIVPWNWVPTNGGTCSYDVVPGDPVIALVHDIATGTGTPTTTTPSTTSTTSTSTSSTTIPSTTTTTVPSAAFARRINAGGNSYTDTAGVVWGPDAYYIKGKTSSTSAAVAGTTAPGLYQTERNRMSGYRVPVPTPGTYTVRLLMAETDMYQPGLRVFTVTAEGLPVAIGLDIFALVGRNVAYVVEARVTTSDAYVDLGFVPLVGTPKVNAIEVVR